MQQKTTAIRRNWRATMGYLAGAILSMGLSVLLFVTIVEETITFAIALIPFILSIILFYMSYCGAGEASCPSCDKIVSGLSTGSNDGILCPECTNYLEGKGGKLWITDHSRIADSPVFSSPLPDEFSFPDGCCVCGSPATHNESVSANIQSDKSTAAMAGVTVLSGGAVSGRAGYTEWTVQVPHCDSHKQGASLGSLGSGKVKISFKSLPYLQAFCKTNNTKPI